MSDRKIDHTDLSELVNRKQTKKENFYLSHDQKKNSFPIAMIVADGDEENCELVYCCEEGNGDFNKIFIPDDDDSKIVMLFDTRDGKQPCFWIGGPRNSGKTTFSRGLIEYFHSVFPKKDIFLVSDVEKDSILDDLDYLIRIPMSEDILNVDVKETLPNCFILFDDVLSIENKQIKDKIMNMIKTILNNGRHYGIVMACTSHLLNPDERSLGRRTMADISFVTFFPEGGIQHQISYFLEHYMGQNKVTVESILKLNSRWVSCYTPKPRMLIWEKGIYRL